MSLRPATGFLFSLPWLLSLAGFWLFPLLFSLYLSFTNSTLFSTSDTFDFSNYVALFSDPAFLSSLKTTAIFVVVTIPITTAISLFFALLLNRAFGGRDFFRAMFFLPWVTSIVVVALIFAHLMQPGGYLYLLASSLGLPVPPHGFLTDHSTALPSIMAMDIWLSVGYYMMIFLAGLQSIPTELYEDAELSGAGRMRRHWSITLPMLRPVAAYVIVINTIKSFQIFTEVYVMTKGKFDTSTSVYFIYETALTTDYRLGYASAAAFVLFGIVLIISLFQLKLISRETA